MWIEDGRSFLHDSDRRYDLVLYAIPDSLTVLAGQSSLRLESYLLTKEAMREVRDHLKPDGVLAMYHTTCRRWWIATRTRSRRCSVNARASTSRRGPGSRPRTVLTVSVRPDGLVCERRWTRPATVPSAVTDDHPFAYLVGGGSRRSTR